MCHEGRFDSISRTGNRLRLKAKELITSDEVLEVEVNPGCTFLIRPNIAQSLIISMKSP